MPDRMKIHYVKPGRPEVIKTDIAKDTRYGLYIVQSESRPDFFRIGATGIHDKGTMRGRLFTTYQRKPSEKNWTTRNLKWKILWVAEIQAGTQFSTVAAEYVIFSHFVRLFSFVDYSGFCSTPEVASMIVDEVRSLEAELEKVIAFQINKE